jgi:hypothetical protein
VYVAFPISEDVIRKLKRRFWRKFEDFILLDGRNIHKAANEIKHTGSFQIIKMNNTNRKAKSLLTRNLLKLVAGLKTIGSNSAPSSRRQGSRIFSTNCHETL